MFSLHVTNLAQACFYIYKPDAKFIKHEKVLSGNVFLQLIIMKWKDLHGLCLDAWNNYFVKMDDINYLFGKRLVVPGLYTDGMFVKVFLDMGILWCVHTLIILDKVIV